MRVREYACLCQNGPTPVFGGPAQENPGFHRDAPAVFQFLGADVGSPMNGWLQLVDMQPKRLNTSRVRASMLPGPEVKPSGGR